MTLIRKLVLGLLLATSAARCGEAVPQPQPKPTAQPADPVREAETRAAAFTQLILESHLSKHDITPGMARTMLKMTAEYLDPSHIVFSKEDIAGIDGIPQEKLVAMAARLLEGNLSNYRGIMDLFAAKRLPPVEAIIADVRAHPDEVRKAVPADPPVGDRPAAADRRARIVALAAALAKSYKSYLSDDDALEMAFLAIEHSVASAKRKCADPLGHVWMYLQSLALSLDAHSNYFPPENNIYERLQKGFVGIGVQIRPTPRGLMIMSVMAAGGAAASGKFAKGDEVVSVDGKELRGMDPDEASAMIRGQEGSLVKVGLLKGDTKKVIEVELRRVTITNAGSEISASRVKTGEGDVAVVKIGSFYSGMAADFHNELAKLTKDGPVIGVVMDLRDNGGGLLDEAVALISEFVPEGVVVGQRDSRLRTTWIPSSHPINDPGVGGSLVILVNEGSASASELTSSALQAYGRAVVVGSSQTFGKGSVQTVFDMGLVHLPGVFAVTIRQFFSPDGRSVQLVGVTPDVMIPGPKVHPYQLESGNPNAIPSATIPSMIKDNEYAKRWLAVRDFIIESVRKASAARVAKNKAFKDAYAEGKPAPDEDYQLEEAEAIASDMVHEAGDSWEWGDSPADPQFHRKK